MTTLTCAERRGSASLRSKRGTLGLPFASKKRRAAGELPGLTFVSRGEAGVDAGRSDPSGQILDNLIDNAVSDRWIARQLAEKWNERLSLGSSPGVGTRLEVRPEGSHDLYRLLAEPAVASAR